MRSFRPDEIRFVVEKYSDVSVEGWAVLNCDPGRSIFIASVSEDGAVLSASIKVRRPDVAMAYRLSRSESGFILRHNTSQRVVALDQPPPAQLFQPLYDLWGDARWRGLAADADLTWGTLLEGRSFWSATQFDTSRLNNILEIGPGYGRLLTGLRSSNCKARYLGLDISPRRVAYLSKLYADTNTIFTSGDCRTVELPETYDAVVSSATMPHIREHFGHMLENIVPYLRPQAQIALDFVEDPADSITADAEGVYFRGYSSATIETIARDHGLNVLSISEYHTMAEHGIGEASRAGNFSFTSDGHVSSVRLLMLRATRP